MISPGSRFISTPHSVLRTSFITSRDYKFLLLLLSDKPCRHQYPVLFPEETPLSGTSLMKTLKEVVRDVGSKSSFKKIFF